MKLKKFAALALAGVMAVSMLAGCANKPGTTDEDKTETTSGITAAAVADAVSADLKTKNEKLNITVSADAGLQTTLDKAAGLYGVSGATVSYVKSAMTTIDTKLDDMLETLPVTFNTASYTTDSTEQTVFGVCTGVVDKQEGLYTDKYFVNEIVKKIEAEKVYNNTASSLATLPTKSNKVDFVDSTNVGGTGTVNGKSYGFAFNYKLNVAVTAVENSLTNQTTYVVAYTLVRTPVQTATADLANL